MSLEDLLNEIKFNLIYKYMTLLHVHCNANINQKSRLQALDKQIIMHG